MRAKLWVGMLAGMALSISAAMVSSTGGSTKAVAAPQCIGLGDRCDFSSDCCSGLCNFQTCVMSSSGSGDMCHYAGEACSSDGECCSGYCASYGACE